MKTSSLLLVAVALHAPTAKSQWVQTNGPHGGFVGTILVAGDTLFVGTSNSLGYTAVFRSTDLGKSWIQANAGLTSTIVNVLKANGSHFLAGTSEGFFLSADHGSTWTPCNAGLTYPNIQTLVAHGDTILAGTSGGGVFRSMDGGQSWAPSNSGLTDPGVWTLAGHGTTIFAGTYQGGVFRSTDDGGSWNQVNAGLLSSDVMALAADNHEMFAGTSRGVFVFQENSLSWKQLNTGLSDTMITTLAAFGGDLYAASSTNTVFLSTDDGITWSMLGSVPVLRSFNHIASMALLKGNLLAGTFGEGLFASTDHGAQWRLIGVPATDVQAFTVSDRYIFAATLSGGIYRTSNRGRSWVQANNGLLCWYMQALAAREHTVCSSGLPFRHRRRSVSVNRQW